MATPLALLRRKLFAAMKEPLLPSDTSFRRRLPLLRDLRRVEWRSIVFFTFIGVIFIWNLGALWSSSRTTTRGLHSTGGSSSTRDKIKKHVLRTLIASNHTDCSALAVQYPEPWTPNLKKQKINLNGPMHAFYRWEGPITKKHLAFQRNLTENRQMPDNTRILLKVKDSMLYVDETDVGFEKVFPKGPKMDVPSLLKDRFDRTVELLLLALEFYEIPDVEFALELQDHTYGGPVWDPVFVYSHWAGDGTNGFTLPSFELYEHSLGKHQMYLKHECLNFRYPYASRTRKAIWRGASTGRPIQSSRDIKLNQRISLSFLGKKLPEILDVGITDYVQVDLSVDKIKDELEYLAPLKTELRLEEYNQYAAVIDLDGNAGSDQIGLLLSANTPVFKQEYSRWMDYFGHLLRDNRNVRFFKEDSSDLVGKVDDFLHLYDVKREVLEHQIEEALEFAVENLSHSGIIRAAAYALTVYASFEDWTVVEEEDFRLIPASKCCKFNAGLPEKLLKKMNPEYQPPSKPKQ